MDNVRDIEECNSPVTEAKVKDRNQDSEMNTVGQSQQMKKLNDLNTSRESKVSHEPISIDIGATRADAYLEYADQFMDHVLQQELTAMALEALANQRLNDDSFKN